ncbi:hypothetical protein BGW42_008143 [Actinomortierella wolfii]|nr:hypothetical protein BGW42_008143 [Actinomortierella wolfii]
MHHLDAFSIPEILMAIGPHLTPREIAACVLVNRLWHQIFTPFFFRAISAVTLAQGLRVTEATAQHVRFLKVSYDSPYLQILADHCRALISLSMSMDTATNWLQCLKLTEQNPRLRSLAFNVTSYRVTIDWDALFRAFTRPSSSLSSLSQPPLLHHHYHHSLLREISISDPYNLLRGPQVLKLLDALPALEVFRFVGRACGERELQSLLHDRKRLQENQQQPNQSQPNQQQQLQPGGINQKLGTSFGLRVLDITESTTSLAMALLHCLPALEHLRMSSNSFDLEEFPPSLATLCPNLKELEILHKFRFTRDPPVIDPASENPYLSTTNAERVERGLRYWRPHSLEKIILAEAYTGATALDILLEHQCRSLKVIRLIMCRPSITSRHIQRLLTLCPELRELTVLGTAAETRLTLRDAVREPWVCTKIEHLRIAVTGVCPGAGFDHEDSSTSNNVENEQQQQEQEQQDTEGKQLEGVNEGASEEERLRHVHQNECLLAKGETSDEGQTDDDNDNDNDSALQHPEACQALERRFYEQLGKLEHLRFLYIPERPHRGFQATQSMTTTTLYEPYDRLSWSLQRGLDAMVTAGPEGLGSQRLEALSVGRSPRIGLAEIQWMHQHLPRLKRILGLSRLPSRHREEIEAWIRQNWPSLEWENYL